MISPKRGHHPDPDPQLLAAYADGELNRAALAGLRIEVEDWLASHPEAAAEVAAQRRLRDLCRATAAPDPGEAAWADVLARVEEGLTQYPAAKSRSGTARVLGWSAAAAACAAAVWLALTWISRDGQEPPKPEPVAAPSMAQQPPAPERFPVASADEVEVLSVAGEDTGSLVVGNLPLQGPMVLAGPGDVTVTRAPPDVVQEGPVPLIWSRTDGELQEVDP